MAMTKAERAEMEKLRVRCALSWPPPPPKPVDLAVAKAATDAVWLHLWSFNRHTGLVRRGVTNGTGLCSPTDYTDAELDARFGVGASRVSLSQGPGSPWYATEADALRALHHDVALECAEKLARVAARVEAALSSVSGEGQ